MSMIFHRKDKDKPASITIETGEELKSLFDSTVVSVDLNKSVKDFIVLLLASHQTIGNINESDYGLYTKESSHTLRRLDSQKTLKENRIKSKDALVFRKGVVAAEIRTSPRGHSVHQLSFREKFGKSHVESVAPKLMRHNSSSSKIGPPANPPPPREPLTLSPPQPISPQLKSPAPQQNTTQTSTPTLAPSGMTRNPSGTFSPSDVGNRLVHRFSRTFSQSSKNFTETSENSRKLIFGVPIRASLSETDAFIPAAIQRCLNYIEENMLEIPKIFIQKADATEIDKLIRILEAGQPVDLHKYSPHVISNLVLQYLEMLRDPLISNDIYKDLLSCEPGMLWRVTLLLAKLPEEHFHLLKRVLDVMRKVLENTQKNGVTIEQLAQTLGPLIMRPRNTNSSADLMSTLSRTKDLAKTMLENATVLTEYASNNVPNISPGEVVAYHQEDVNCAHNTGNESSQHQFFGGILWITNYQIIWKSTERESMNSGMWSDLRIPNRSILYLERYKHPIVGKMNKEVFAGLNVICRNFRYESFVFPSRKFCKRAFRVLARYAFDEDPRNSFAFYNSESFIGTFNGWKVYKCSEEFKRLGLNHEAWRISEINKKYEFCDIYPKHLIVPNYITDDILQACARNREHSRIPILVWKHPTNHAVLLRSGPTLNVIKADGVQPRDNDLSGNQLVEAVLINVLKSRQGIAELNNTQSSIEIADMGGPPPTAHYHYQCIQSIWFSDSPQPRQIQEKLQMLLDVVVRHPHTSAGFDKQFESCGYASILRGLLSAARKVSQMLVSGVSVITQGTLSNSLDHIEFALVSLSLMMLDPFYRTIQGLMVLIEKEWCQFAFPFNSSKKNKANDSSTMSDYVVRGEITPLFLLFLDCIWQIYKDSPDAFEFNARLLIFLADQSFCGRFGTFLGGIDRDMVLAFAEPGRVAKDRLNFKRAMKAKTVSVWNYVNYHKEQFLNPLFDPKMGTVLPDMSKPISFRLWNTYYLRYTTAYKGAEYMKKIHAAKITPDTSLHLEKLNLPCIPVLSDDVMPVFRHFSHIQYLDLSGNYFNVCPADAMYLTHLRKLNMLRNKLRIFPAHTFLKHWSTSLEELILSENHITSLPVAAQLRKLSSLTVLRMASNRLNDIVSVGNLVALKTLDLSNNMIVSVPKDISSLQHLQELILFKNQLKSLPDDLSGLSMLKSLSLAHNKLFDIPPGIYHLANLQILDVSNNNIENIPNEISRLQNLRIFNMSNNDVYLLPPALYQLGSLLDLDLSNNKISELHANVLHLSSLLRLAMQDNKISDIPIEISGLHTLTELNLSHNELAELTPAIGQLSSLVKLDLQDNKITQLPQTLGNLAKTIRFLHVDIDKITNIPTEIIQRGNEAILSYLGEVMQSDQPAYRIKLMVIGKDNVGKTALTNCLRKKHKKFADNCNTLSTDGIDIDTWSFTVENEAGEKQKVDVNIWDMAGQEVYYTTHQFFLSEATIYVVVWNVVQGENSETGENKIEYWLRTLKARCGDSVPPAIFVVGTHIDDPTVPRDLDKNILFAQRARYKGLFPSLEVHFRVVSCMSGDGIDALRKDIQAVALKQKNMGKPKPSSWFLLEKCLMRERTKRVPPIMYGEEAKLLGQACGISDTQTLHNALAWLHDTGNVILFNQDGGVFGTNDKGIVVLDPRWLSNTFTTIFTTRHQWARGGGLLFEDLQHIWRPPVYPQHLHRALLSLAEKFEIVFLLDKKHTLPIYDESNKLIKIAGRKPSLLSLGAVFEDERTPDANSPISSSGAISNSPSFSAEREKGNTIGFPGSPISSSGEDLVILVPSLLPASKPPTLPSLWPSAPQMGEAQLGRRYQLEFIPIGLFSRVIVRCLRLCKAKICWQDGILLESNEVTSSGESNEKILVEVNMMRKCIDVTGRSKHAGTTSVNFSLSRAVLECIETLVKDYFKLPVRTFIPCIHCIMLNTTPKPESRIPKPDSPPVYISSPETGSLDRGRKRTMSISAVPSTPPASSSSSSTRTKVPYFFELEKCENAVVEGLTIINCNKNSTVTPVKLALLAPDLIMSDFFGRRIEFCDMVLGKKIGDGGSASVFKADWSGKQVAVKKLKQVSGMDANGVRVDAVDTDAFSQTFHEFRREAYIMSGLSHPNLVQFEGLCLSPLCIVMEYMPGGNLYELLHSDEPLSWRMKIKISTDVATGLAYLHRGNIIHRDLKSPNVLMSGKKDSIIAKVTDFGLSGLSSVMSGRAVVNPVWLAPEVLRNAETPDPTKIDVYAFGVILYEIATRLDFFGNENFMTVVEEKVIKGERPPIPADCPAIFSALIEACWDNEPMKRPTFSKICDDLMEIKTALKHAGLITEKETDEGEAQTPQGQDMEVMDSSDDERRGVRRTKSDGDVITPKRGGHGKAMTKGDVLRTKMVMS